MALLYMFIMPACVAYSKIFEFTQKHKLIKTLFISAMTIVSEKQYFKTGYEEEEKQIEFSNVNKLFYIYI